MNTQGEVKPADRLRAEMERQGVTVKATFVPWSKSRGFKPGAKVTERSLNWKVTIEKAGREILTTDYTAGIAHALSYTQRLTTDAVTALEWETETGKKGKDILPDPIGVVWSLCQDSSVLDAGGFEDWASEYGLDPDSRKAEADYRACLEIALKLRAGLGDSGLQALRDAGQDY